MLKQLYCLNGLINYCTLAVMKNISKRTILLILAIFFQSGFTTVAHAIVTECNNNGGLGWTINDGGITNLAVPFDFGDDSVIYDLDVSADITHTWMGDLTLSVTNPTSGTEVLLFERPGTTAPDSAPASVGPFGCDQNDLNATFDDEAGTTNIENVCTTPIAGTFLPHNPAPNNLSAFDGDNLNGDWNVYLSDSANQDIGTLNQICLTASFAGVTFDKWVSSNASCTDTIDSLAIAPGTDIYFCYSVLNPGDETFTINPGGTSDSQGHDLSALEKTYVPLETFSIDDGPFDSRRRYTRRYNSKQRTGHCHVCFNELYRRNTDSRNGYCYRWRPYIRYLYKNCR